MSGFKCTTDFAYRPSKHTETLTALRPWASGLIARLKARSNCVWSLVLQHSQTMIALKFEQNADFSHSDYWKSVQNGSFIFLGNTRDQASACFCCSCPKVFRNPTSELTSPHTHLTRTIMSGFKCTTDFAYRPSKHTETLTALRPWASGLIARLKARSNCVWSLVLPFSQTMIALKFEQNADFSHSDYWKSVQNGSFIFLGNTRDQASACFCLLLPKKFSGIRHPNLQVLIRI